MSDEPTQQSVQEAGLFADPPKTPEWNEIRLDGNTLRLEDILPLLQGSPVVITESAYTVVGNSRRLLEDAMREKIIYGVNTGFGPMASHIIHYEEMVNLQRNLIRSHAVGMGEPVSSSFVLAAMLVRLNTLVKGPSGVSRELLEQLLAFINKRIIPVIPEHGAVGTSGDLVQLAHIGLALIGEGEVIYEGRRRRARDVLEEVSLTPYSLKPKEGLSLINGTSFMTGIAAVLSLEAERLLDISLRWGGAALEITQAFDDYISKRLHQLRPHEGQRWVAKRLRVLLESSKRMRQRDMLPSVANQDESVHKIDEEVQSVYSLRCIPQIVGPVAEAIFRTRKIVETEMNSATDNPLVDMENGQILHGGNFHGESIAATVDELKARLVKLIMLSERRINFFLHRGINKKFPPFINLRQPGLTLGLQGLQFVATSTAAHSQSLAFPHSVHSIPTNADNQDIVSMGADASLMLAKVIENAYIVFAIEGIVLSQAVEAERIMDDLSLPVQTAMKRIQGIFPPVYDDRDMSGELPRLVELLKAEDWDAK